MTAVHRRRFSLAGQPRISHARYRNDLFWKSRARLHLRFCLPAQEIKFRNDLIIRLVRATIMHGPHFLLADGANRLWSKVTAEDLQNPRNPVVVAQDTSPSSGATLSWGRMHM